MIIFSQFHTFTYSLFLIFSIILFVMQILLDFQTVNDHYLLYKILQLKKHILKQIL
jgi:hypothetical protein